MRCNALSMSFVLITILASSGCKKDPHDLMLESDDPESIGHQLKDAPGLSDEETRMLTAAILRSKMGAAFGGKAPEIKGQKVGDIINKQRDIIAEEAKQEEALKQKAAAEKAKQEAQAEQLRQALGLTVVDKGFRAANVMEGSLQAYITFKCMYQNNTDKPVRAFRGTVVFTDLFGEPIHRTRVTISETVAPHASGSWQGAMTYNQFIESQAHFKNTPLKDMKVTWYPKSIMFADGTQLGEADAAQAQASDD